MDNIYCPWLVNDNQRQRCDVFVSNYQLGGGSCDVESQTNRNNPRNQQHRSGCHREEKQCWPDDFRNTYRSSLHSLNDLGGLVQLFLTVLLAIWLTSSLSEATTTSHPWRYSSNGVRETTGSQFVNSNFAYNPVYSSQGNTAYNDRNTRFIDRQSYSRPDIQEPVLYDYNSVQVSHTLEALGAPTNFLRTQNFKISPKPCSIGRVEGTCMFVWECIKSEGRHVGMCVDSFMFGSCCAHNYTDNIVLPNSFSYTRPTKPVGMASMNHRPPQHAHRPSISGMTTIERPHGAGTLVIRPSGPHHQGPLNKPQQQKPSHLGQSITTTSTTTTTQQANDLWVDNNHVVDMQATNNIPAVHIVNQHQWYLTTEPNFITKPRPTSWEKPISLRPKPPKPSKKPINSTLLWLAMQHQHQPNHHHQQQQQQHQQLHYIRPTVRPTSFSTVGHNGSITRKPTKPPKPTTLWPITMLTGTSTAITSTSDSSTTLTSSLSTANKPLTQTPNTRPTTIANTATAITIIKQPATTTTTTRTTTTTIRPYSHQPAINIINHNYNNSLLNTVKPPAFLFNITTSTPTVAVKQNFSSSATSVSTTAAQISTNTLTNSTTAGFNNLLQKPSKYTTTTTTTTTTKTMMTTTTLRPLSAASAFNNNKTVSFAGSSVLPETLTTIESNEITDSGRHIIKTISVARSECGMPVLARPETRIVGGKSAAFGRWPWQVSVRRTSFFGFSSTHRCGGALINENWIATAGHCVDDLLISQIRIRVGEYDFSHVQEQLPYIERGVTKKIVHPQYNFFTYEYDLALVKLEQPLEFAPHVSPICLPQTNSLLIGMNATVTGWGRLSEGGTLPSVLQEVSVPIVSNDNCKSMFLRAGRQEFIPEIFLCAGYETGGQDSCQGDSGGPLQVKSQDGRYFLAGIISWGIGCAEANLPGVCTRISKFVPWIIENVT